MAAAKLLIEVSAGLIPGRAIHELTRVWAWTSEEQQALQDGDREARCRYALIHGESREYAASLEDPRRLNWVRLALAVGDGNDETHD